jgi:hypothetical protein
MLTTMLWLNRLKISIAGAKLSHLIQKDKIWDHGSMMEHVKIVFQQLQKAMRYRNAEPIRKYMTIDGFNKAQQHMMQLQNEIKNDGIVCQLNEVDIIKVSKGSKSKPDCFRALIKGEKKIQEVDDYVQRKFKENEFEEEWVFIRQGDWWLLKEIKPVTYFLSRRNKFAIIKN